MIETVMLTMSCTHTQDERVSRCTLGFEELRRGVFFFLKKGSEFVNPIRALHTETLITPFPSKSPVHSFPTNTPVPKIKLVMATRSRTLTSPLRSTSPAIPGHISGGGEGDGGSTEGADGGCGDVGGGNGGGGDSGGDGGSGGDGVRHCNKLSPDTGFSIRPFEEKRKRKMCVCIQKLTSCIASPQQSLNFVHLDTQGTMGKKFTLNDLKVIYVIINKSSYKLSQKQPNGVATPQKP